MTGYGFTGPMTARGTVFDAKAQAVEHVGSRYRYGYRYQWTGLWWFIVWGGV